MSLRFLCLRTLISALTALINAAAWAVLAWIGAPPTPTLLIATVGALGLAGMLAPRTPKPESRDLNVQ
jgi:hypothetical protein